MAETTTSATSVNEIPSIKEMRAMVKWASSGSEVSFNAFAATKDMRTALAMKEYKYFTLKSLMGACSAGCVTIVKALIHFGVSPHLVDDDPEKNTPLIKACSKGHLDVVELLLSFNVNVHQTNTLGMTALMATCRQGHIVIAKYLIDMGALIDAQSSSRYTAILFAVEHCRLECLQLLIDFKANLDIKNSSGFSPLLMAAKQGHVEVIRALLLSNNINVNVRTNANETALHLAVGLDREDAVALLINAGVDVNMASSDWYRSYTPLMLAASRNRINIVRLLLESGADPLKNTDRHQSAISVAATEEIKDLIRNFNEQDYLLK